MHRGMLPKMHLYAILSPAASSDNVSMTVYTQIDQPDRPRYHSVTNCIVVTVHYTTVKLQGTMCAARNPAGMNMLPRQSMPCGMLPQHELQCSAEQRTICTHAVTLQ